MLGIHGPLQSQRPHMLMMSTLRPQAQSPHCSHRVTRTAAPARHTARLVSRPAQHHHQPTSSVNLALARLSCLLARQLASSSKHNALTTITTPSRRTDNGGRSTAFLADLQQTEKYALTFTSDANHGRENSTTVLTNSNNDTILCSTRCRHCDSLLPQTTHLFMSKLVTHRLLADPAMQQAKLARPRTF